ncbi:PREDICTED: centrosomal protein of 63 kDa-like [Nicotiana attenuata]|uniref:centrosomal protein of 63 kDa-like n=1 Tax=Nicotiana attenuata TaxID=49451 RepID=UPI0009047997|nr:PREDICTED: centrosomal protein of 63 kDa-like [Nicotiana attenuata]
MKTPDVGTSHGENDIFGECLAGIEKGPDLDASFILEEAEKLQKRSAMLFHQAFSKCRVELARCEDELKNLMSEIDGLKDLYAKREGELNDLRASSTKASQERSELIEKEKADLVEQLQEELKTKEAVTLGWKQSMDRLASEKDSLQEQLASTESQLRSAKEEGHKFMELHTEMAAELSNVKSEADAFMSSYRTDAAAANARVREILATTELKLSCTVNNARLESRKKTLEEVHAKGFDLSTEIEKVKALEKEAAALLSTDEDSVSDSESGEDEDEVPEEEEAPEYQVAEGQTTEVVVPMDVASERVTPIID